MLLEIKHPVSDVLLQCAYWEAVHIFRRNCKKIVLAAIILGIGIMVVIILPSGFWFFALGLIFIVAGLAIINSCR